MTINSLFVSHHGDDLKHCGNWSTPCRTVRQAVKMSNDGDEIYIDYSQRRPYMECENETQSTCSIELTKSVSFHGINGKPEIQCRKCKNFFTITSPSFNTTRIKFVNLVLSNSNVVAELGAKASTELVYQNMLVRDNVYALYSKYSSDCSIKIFNSSFEHNLNLVYGIYLKCANLTVHINSGFFKLTPLLFQNFGNIPTRWMKTEILVQNTSFDGKKIKNCAPLLAIKPFAAIYNVTIIDSVFKSHFENCSHVNRISTLQISDHSSHVRKITFILLSNLIFENNYNNWASLSLTAGYLDYTAVDVVITKSIFRNNSVALRVNSHHFDTRSSVKHPTIILEDNTFVENFYEMLKSAAAAAIYFDDVNSRVSSCRFFDNKSGPNPYTGVVTISETARVTFFNSYFENRQTTKQANQLFASGNQPVYFSGENTFNLVALKGSQTVFTRGPTVDINTRVTIRTNFQILCPQGYKMNSQSDCVNIKNAYVCYYIILQCEQCPTKTYTLEKGKFIFNKSNIIQCQKCPRGGDCNSGPVRAKPNFWGYKTKMKIIFDQCPPGYCCNTEDCITYDSCHGNRTGTLCGQCSDGMSESLFSTQCITNTECSLNYFFIFATTAMLVLYLVFFLYHKEIVKILQKSLFSKRLSFSINSRNDQRNNSTITGNTSSPIGMVKIFFYYYQVCYLLRSSVTSPKKGQYIHIFENVISRVVNMVLVGLPSINCPLKDLRAVPKTVILHSVGYCLLCFLCLLYLINKLFRVLRRLRNNKRIELQFTTTTRSDHRSNTSKSSFSQRVASAFTYISLLMYASSAQLCLSLLHCVPIGDNQVLFLDGNIKCYQTFQYFLLAYMISSILPFCLVPVLGSYLLKSGLIGVKQFCVACIFPLPFCSFWLYLLLKDCRCGNQGTYNTIEESDNAVGSQQSNNETQSLSSDEITFVNLDGDETSRSKAAILRVVLGPFRLQQAFMCFPSSHIPWEGFLIFRRLILIIALTFVYDIQLKLFLALTLCVAILILHMLVNPFQRKRDNVLESFSLGTHVVLCGLTLIKALYYGEDYSFSESFPVLNVIESILVVAPLSIIMIVVMLSIAIKLVLGLKLCILFLIRNTGRLVGFAL